MKKSYLRVLSLSTLLLSLSFVATSCSCSGKCKVTFVSEENSDVVRYVKKGEELKDIPEVPQVRGKYCLWEDADFSNINQDMTVHANCYSSVSSLETNLEREYDVEISSEEASLDYIFKGLEIEATFEDGTTKVLYEDDYKIDANGYNKDKAGAYLVYVKYNNASVEVRINVHKIDNYVTVSLYDSQYYYNEGLPNLVVHGDVEGVASFDPNQTLVVGSKVYNWTFVPNDTTKYATIHGKTNVTLVDASAITANKQSLKVEYGTTKAQILESLQDGLIVRGKYGNLYRELSPNYYTIDSSDFVVGYSGIFDFTIRYGTLYTTIPVEVEKCDTYNLTVNSVEEFIYKSDSTLNDVIESITYNSSIAGNITFATGQTLSVGDYEYNYVFTPTNSNYAPKRGLVRVKTYQAESVEFASTTNFIYDSSEQSIKQNLVNNLTGTINYNGGHTKTINKNLVTEVVIDGYDSETPGTYTYHVAYNDEINFEGTFVLDKIVLAYGTDFDIINTGHIDPNNYSVLPGSCVVERNVDSRFNFDPDDFTLVQLDDGVEIGGGFYSYRVALVPNDTISATYDTVIFDALVFSM